MKQNLFWLFCLVGFFFFFLHFTQHANFFEDWVVNGKKMKKASVCVCVSDEKWEHAPLNFWWTEAWRTPSDCGVTSSPWTLNSSARHTRRLTQTRSPHTLGDRWNIKGVEILFRVGFLGCTSFHINHHHSFDGGEGRVDKLNLPAK